MGAKHERVANKTKWEKQKHNKSTLRIVHIDLNRIVLHPLPGDKVVQHRQSVGMANTYDLATYYQDFFAISEYLKRQKWMASLEQDQKL